MTRTSTPTELFTQAVDSIYAAVSGESGWDGALEALCDFVGARAADVHYLDIPNASILRFHPARLDPFVLRYSAEFMADPVNQNPRVPVVINQMREGDLIADSDLWDAAERRRSPFFGGLLQPWGTYDSLITIIRRCDDASRPAIVLAAHFSKAKSPPQEAQRRRLLMLAPHIRRAAGSEEKLAAALRQRAALSETIDRIADPIILLDRAGKALKSNPAADCLLRKTGALGLSHDNRLIFSDSAAREAFSRALSECIEPALLLNLERGRPPRRIAVKRIGANPLLLTLQPLSRQASLGSDAVAVVFISDPDMKAEVPRNTLQAAFELTPREAELAQELLRGKRIEQYAHERRVTISTVRSQIRSIYAKTHTSRQAELVNLLRGMPPSRDPDERARLR